MAIIQIVEKCFLPVIDLSEAGESWPDLISASNPMSKKFRFGLEMK
jgi:hypothetical protein